MKSCLIVDDSKVIRKVARHILETLQFEVEEAGDGQEALTACESKMPDVVLLDWNMPVMSGMEFLKLLRQRGHSANVGEPWPMTHRYWPSALRSRHSNVNGSRFSAARSEWCARLSRSS